MRILYTIVIFACIFQSCKDKNLSSYTSPVDPIKIERFDLDLSQFDLKNFDASHQQLLKKYPTLYPFYVENLMGMGTIHRDSGQVYFQSSMEYFLNGENKALQDTFEQLVYPHIPEVETKLTTAFSHFKYYYPNRQLPKIYSMFISPNGAQLVSTFSLEDDVIGINWFGYLGKNFTFYSSFYYNYQLEWNQMSYIPRNVMLVEYDLMYPSDRNKRYDELLYQMIESAKKYFYLDYMIPEEPDCIKIGYTPEQWKWCEANEEEIWKFFVENKYLYSVDGDVNRHFISPGPTSTGMPKESPGMVGTWVGLKMLRIFAQKNPDLKLDQIIRKNPKDIATAVNYKPSKN